MQFYNITAEFIVQYATPTKKRGMVILDDVRERCAEIRSKVYG
jgi:hypothetical protein